MAAVVAAVAVVVMVTAEVAVSRAVEGVDREFLNMCLSSGILWVRKYNWIIWRWWERAKLVLCRW